MAILINRKLLPLLTSPPNLPSPCLNLCDPSCTNLQQDCYLLPDPILYPPDPSPPPTNPGFHIPTVVIVVIIVFVLVFMVVSCCTVFVKWTRFATRRSPGRPNPGHLETDDDDQGQDRDLESFNPIWLISTVGLQQSVISSITKINYKKGEGLIEGTDCSVCLSEFQEGESLRLLPKCDHAFHIDCVDTWLRSHTNCPLCRAPVVINPGQVSAHLDSYDPSFENSRRTEMDLSESNEIDLGSSLSGGGIGSSVVSENREGREIQHSEYDAENGQNKVGVGRSVSMDFFLGRISRDVGDPGLQRNLKSSSFRMVGSSSSWRAVLGSSGSQVKRSYSWGEKIFGSARYQKRNSDLESSS